MIVAAGRGPQRAVGLVLLIAAPFVVCAVGFDFINGFPYGLTYDDAYFYAQIGYNLGELGRSTFDQVSTTSGYHLLWGGLLGLVSSAVGLGTASKAVHLYAFEVVFTGLALLAARAFHSRFVERACFLVLVVMGTLLMETLLLSCLLLVFARAHTQGPITGARARFAVDGAALLVPLARIDAAMILVTYAVLLAFQGERRSASRTLAAVALGVAVQLVLMMALFGEPFSVSSMIKAWTVAPLATTVWSSVVGPEGPALGYIVRSALFVGLAASALGICLLESDAVANRRLFALSLGATAFSATHFVSHMMPFWCYLPAYLVLFYTLCHCEIRRPVLRTTRTVSVAAMALLGLVFVAHKAHIYRANQVVVRGARDFAARIKDHVPPSGRIFQVDGSGFTGFFSERSVVDGDGLVGSYEYARRRRAGRLAGILDEQGVCYVITNRASANGVLVDFAGLRVTTGDAQEVLRSEAYGLFPATDFVLYRRIAPPCGPAA